MSRVRRKLGTPAGEPGRIRTFQGIGYLLDIEGPTPAHAGRAAALEELGPVATDD